jgi:hypothetical protein
MVYATIAAFALLAFGGTFLMRKPQAARS